MNLLLEVYGIFCLVILLFNQSKNNTAVLEPRTGHFRETELRGQGLHKMFSRRRTSSRTSPLTVTRFDFTSN